MYGKERDNSDDGDIPYDLSYEDRKWLEDRCGITYEREEREKRLQRDEKYLKKYYREEL